MSNRRDFLRNASLLTAGGLLAGNAGMSANASSTGKANKTLGLQIYSLMDELYDDLPKRMKALKDMGYTKLELSRYKEGKIGGIDMMEFKKIANDAGLTIISSLFDPYIEGHTDPFLLDYHKDMMPKVSEFWKRAADDHAKLGCKYVIQITMPVCKSHERAYLLCDFFNEAGRIAKAAGLQYAYHNHHMEFERLLRPEDAGKNKNPWTIPGDQIYDLFLAGTDPGLVIYELDVYWIIRGGSDPVEYMRNHPDRIKLIHIKDATTLGTSGLLNFKNIFDQMYKNGIQDFFVELEPLENGKTQFQGVKECADFLQEASFVKP
jgi:sugar phosphate isomerase/epimerase